MKYSQKLEEYTEIFWECDGWNKKQNDPTEQERQGKKTGCRGGLTVCSLQPSQEERMKHPTATWSTITGSELHSAMPRIRQFLQAEPGSPEASWASCH